jgi:hypothetical protein
MFYARYILGFINPLFACLLTSPLLRYRVVPSSACSDGKARFTQNNGELHLDHYGPWDSWAYVPAFRLYDHLCFGGAQKHFAFVEPSSKHRKDATGLMVFENRAMGGGDGWDHCFGGHLPWVTQGQGLGGGVLTTFFTKHGVLQIVVWALLMNIIFIELCPKEIHCPIIAHTN